jgi:hypothetical protein
MRKGRHSVFSLFLNKGGCPMTIIGAIGMIDALKPNTYSQEEKIKWLSNLDLSIKKEIIDTHEGGEEIEFNGYDVNTPLDTELLAEAPYDEMYVFCLESQIDYANGEYGKYNNSITAFNSALSNFRNYYNRKHMPLTQGFKYF